MIEITKDEATSIQEFIEGYLFDAIREDEFIDNIEWLNNIMSVYKKCKEGEQK